MTIDICGAFFLSVEAIKLQNIVKLRDVVLPKISAAIESPQIAIGDPSPEERREIAEYNKRAGFGNRIFLYVLSHFLGGLALVFAAYYGLRLFNVGPLRPPTNWPTDISWLDAIGIIGGSIVAIVFGLIALWFLGELLLHIIIPGAVRGVVGFLHFLDRKTIDGTIGLIGFSLITVGFMLQMFGTSIGAHTSQNLR